MNSKEEEIKSEDIKNMTKIGNGTFGDIYSTTIKNKKIAVKKILKSKFYKYKDREYLIKAFFKELECMKKCECENSVKIMKYEETKIVIILLWNYMMEI